MKEVAGMKLFTIECGAPGYQPSGDTRAFTGKRPLTMGIDRIQREWGGNAAAAHVLAVTTDVPGRRSALSFVRRA